MVLRVGKVRRVWLLGLVVRGDFVGKVTRGRVVYMKGFERGLWVLWGLRGISGFSYAFWYVRYGWFFFVGCCYSFS